MNPQNILPEFLFCVFLDTFLYIWHSFITETINYILTFYILDVDIGMVGGGDHRHQKCRRLPGLANS